MQCNLLTECQSFSKYMLKEENTQTFRGCSIIFSGPLKKRKHPQNVWFFSFFNMYFEKLWHSLNLEALWSTCSVYHIGLQICRFGLEHATISGPKQSIYYDCLFHMHICTFCHMSYVKSYT